MVQEIIEVPYNGEPVKVTIENDIPFGKVQDLLMDMTESVFGSTDNKGKTIASMIELSQKMLERVVVTAPWDLEADWPSRIGIKTNKALVGEISKIYPLEELFADLIQNMATTSPSQIESTPNAQ